MYRGYKGYKRELGVSLPMIILITIVVIFVVNGLVILIDKSIRTSDVEIWSGRVEGVYHKDAWKEWHPPETYTETEYYTDSNGDRKSRTVTKTKPGYWEHHPAINEIKTSDGGTIRVSVAPDGTKFNDNYPRNDGDLLKYWPIGSPSASLHRYTNYLKASNSIFKHDGINHETYELPEYPKTVINYIKVERLIGEFKNKEVVSDALDEWNSYLNKMIIGEGGNKRSYKQVNVIIVNMGSVGSDYGFALQERWENGNKNDFIVAFGSDSDKVTWCYPFSWTEEEIVKIWIRDYMLGVDLSEDFTESIDTMCTIIEDNFVRKEMKDYEYIQIEVSTAGVWVMVILNLIILGVGGYMVYEIKR